MKKPGSSIADEIIRDKKREQYFKILAERIKRGRKKENKDK